MKSYYEIRPIKRQSKKTAIKNAVKNIVETIIGCSILLFFTGLMGLAIGLVETYVK